MLHRWSFAGALPLLAAAAICLCPAPAHAQRSIWGNPVITLGETPYHAVSTGHGNYPGSDGFIPGYGYYPGNNPSRYPWLNGPDSPDYTRMSRQERQGLLNPTARSEPIDEPLAEGTALLTIRVPAEAEIWISGQKTNQQGVWRRFVSPTLTADGMFFYEIRARWQQDGKPIERTKEVDVRRGDRLTVDFLTTAASAPLQMPRKIVQP